MNGNDQPPGELPPSTHPLDQKPDPMPPQVPPKTSGAAIGSLVFSCLGAVCILPVIGPLVGIITGFIGMSGIKKSGGRLTGNGLALAGVIVGFGALVINAIAIVGIVASIIVAQPYIEVTKQMEKVRRAVENRDLDQAAAALTGPGSISKEEVMSRFEEIQAEYGQIQSGKLIELTPEQNNQNPTLTPPINVRMTFHCEKGSIRGRFRFTAQDGKYLLREFKLED
jgi:hypothetical protein